jgi:RNA polymerase sigma-70 factor, ECF subfamily
MDGSARAAAVARASYGRLIAILASRTRDIAGAEEALSDAFLAALETWPKSGIPENPEAWLMTAAKNRTIDRHRRAARSPVMAVDELPDVEDEMQPDPFSDEPIPDKRLALMFVCAHPAIDVSVHTPLMLQVVLAFEAADIGRSFLVSPTALAQRLVRAKRKIKDTRIAFEIPNRSEMPSRLSAVMEAIYGGYALDWLHDPNARDMAEEALYLAKLLAELVPNNAEVLGLAALIGFAQARQKARVINGAFVPLDEQNMNLWDKAKIADGNAALARAASLHDIGRFQLEAAIQQVHLGRADNGETNWKAILHLSEGLCRLFPTRGAFVNRAAAIAEVHGPEIGLLELQRLAQISTEPFQPHEAVRAHFLAKLGRKDEARAAYNTAISLTPEPPLREWLTKRLEAVG